MSRLDLTLQERVLLETDKVYKDLIKNVPLKQDGIDSSSLNEQDLKEWLQVFEEDQVVFEGCR